MIYPLGPSIVLDKTPPDPEVIDIQSRARVTWSLSNTQLEEILDIAWNALNPQTDDILINIPTSGILK